MRNVIAIIMASLLVPCTGVSGQEHTSPEPGIVRHEMFSFPPDPEFTVLEYVEPTGMAWRDKKGNTQALFRQLLIQGDGRTIVRRPNLTVEPIDAAAAMQETEGSITYTEMLELLATLHRRGVLAYDVQAEVAKVDTIMYSTGGSVRLRIHLSELILADGTRIKDFHNDISNANFSLDQFPPLRFAIKVLKNRFFE